MVERTKSRKKRKIKNAILRFVAYVNGIVFILSACAIDSPSYLPFIICCITGTYLTIFAYANDWFEEGWEYEQ